MVCVYVCVCLNPFYRSVETRWSPCRQVDGVPAVSLLQDEGASVQGVATLRVSAAGRLPEKGVWGEHQNGRDPTPQVAVFDLNSMMPN